MFLSLKNRCKNHCVLTDLQDCPGLDNIKLSNWAKGSTFPALELPPPPESNRESKMLRRRFELGVTPKQAKWIQTGSRIG